ncbi:MAG TPA: GIY-YIG nuclease family protein [Polyangiaceae bacterium]|jgi:putative endonuclease
MKAWSVYIARCADGTLYVGIARDVAARIAAHDAGKGARYTRGRGPLRLLAKRRCMTQGDALRLELALKALPRDEKLALAASRHKLSRFARGLAPSARSLVSSGTRPAQGG